MSQKEDKKEKEKEKEKEKLKVIVVVTNVSKMGNGKATGWYLPEVAHPYYVFLKSGVEVIFASPKGGFAPVDPGSVKNYEKDEECVKFLKDKVDDKGNLDTYAISALNHKEYRAIFWSGGHGTMLDFADDFVGCNAGTSIYENGGVVSAVCHGPAGLLNVKLKNGDYLIKDKMVTGFSNEEETEAQMDKVVPYSLEHELKTRGAKYISVKNWGSNVVVDKRVITGQNPASAKATAEAIVDAIKQK